MKKSLFSKGIYFEALRRIRIFSIIVAALSIASVITTSLSYVGSTLMMGQTSAGILDASVVTTNTLTFPILSVCTIFAFVMTLVLFSQYNSRQYCDFYHSLPYTRTCIYLSSLAAIFTILFGIIIVTEGLMIIILSIFPFITINFVGYASHLLTIIAAMIFVVAVTSLAMSVTGRTFSGIITAFVIGLFPRYVLLLVNMVTNIDLSLLFTGTHITPLSYNLNALFYTFTGLLKTGKLSLVPFFYTIIVSLIYFVLAGLAYKTRKSETASRASSNKIFHIIIRCIVGCAISLPGTVIILLARKENLLYYIGAIAAFYLLGTIAYFAYEIITTRKWKNLLKALPFFAIVVVLNLIFAGGILLGEKAALNFAPEKYEIQSVKIVENDSLVSLLFEGAGYEDSSFKKLADETVFDNDEMKDFISRNLKETIKSHVEDDYYNTSYNTIYVAIKCNGITRYRAISLTDSENARLKEVLESNEQFQKTYMTIPEYFTNTVYIDKLDTNKLSDDEINEIFTCLQNEINEIGFTKWYQYNENRTYYETYNEKNDLIYITFTAKNDKSSNVNVYVDSATLTKTYNFIIKYNCKYQKDGAAEVLKTIISNFESNQRFDYSVSADLYKNDKVYYGYFYDTANELTVYKELLNVINSSSENDSFDTYLYIDLYCYNPNSKLIFNTYNSVNVYIPIPKDYDTSLLEENLSYTESYEDEIIYD